jgi:hypothetical protein
MNIASLPITERAPEPQPSCFGCGKPRKATYDLVDDKGVRTYGRGAVSRVFGGWAGYGHFCTTTCAVRYANWIVEHHGIRLKARTR